MQPQSRRAFLKLIAAAPVAITFATATSPLLRFLKPTMRPLSYFQPPDMPRAEGIQFKLADFPESWTCLPFMCSLKYVEFNAEKEVIREIPAFMIKLPDGNIVAYSRKCPYNGCILNFHVDTIKGCGCGSSENVCCCTQGIPNPVLMCPCDLSTFDLANNGRVIHGPAPRPPRRIWVQTTGDAICVVGIESGGIA